MKLLNYEKIENDMIVGIFFDDGTCSVARIKDNTRPKEEILKDAYIILKNTERFKYEGNIDGLEDFILPKSVPTFMDVDFYTFTGKVYDQYGEQMDMPISYSVEGTDKARIEDCKLITEEVDDETSFFVVAKCGDLVEKQKRWIYPKAVEPQGPTVEERLAATEQAMADLMLMLGGMQ